MDAKNVEIGSGRILEKWDSEGDVRFYIKLLFILLLSPITIYFLFIGPSSQCKSEPKLPFWMIIIGACLLLEQIFSVIIITKSFLFEKSVKMPADFEGIQAYQQQKILSRPAFLMIFRLSIRTCIFGLSIVGFLWSSMAFSSNCDDFVLYPSFAISLSVLLLAIFLICHFLVVICCSVADYFDQNQ